MSQDTKRKDNTQLRLSDEASDVIALVMEMGCEDKSRSACASRLIVSPPLPVEIFDGWTVFNHLTDKQKLRTTSLNVSDVLDALKLAITHQGE